MYSAARYFTITGQHLVGTPHDATLHQEALYEVHGRIFGPQVITRPDGTSVCFCPRCDSLATLLPDGRCPGCNTRPVVVPEHTTTPIAAPAAPLSDTEVLEKARHEQHATTFLTLWFGDWGTYPSQAEADAALCSLLAVSTQDVTQIDRLFRRSELRRDKWDERRGAQTYGERTIVQARKWHAANVRQPTLLVHGVSTSRNGTSPGPEPHDPYACPELPDYARVDEAAAAKGSRFLDDYIAFSRPWAPRAYDGFHEACGLFALSTVAARRVRFHFGPRGVCTSLYIAIVARTTLFTKTTAANLAIEVIKAAGLGYLLATAAASPQAFLRSLTRYVPSNFAALPDEEQERLRLQLAFTAQRGWHFEAWGQHREAMMQKNGFMTAFRGILRRMDDHKERYTYSTITRGQDVIIRPYLTLLGDVTRRPLESRSSKRGRRCGAMGISLG